MRRPSIIPLFLGSLLTLACAGEQFTSGDPPTTGGAAGASAGTGGAGAGTNQGGEAGQAGSAGSGNSGGTSTGGTGGSGGDAGTSNGGSGGDAGTGNGGSGGDAGTGNGGSGGDAGTGNGGSGGDAGTGASGSSGQGGAAGTGNGGAAGDAGAAGEAGTAGTGMSGSSGQGGDAGTGSGGDAGAAGTGNGGGEPGGTAGTGSGGDAGAGGSPDPCANVSCEDNQKCENGQCVDLTCEDINCQGTPCIDPADGPAYCEPDSDCPEECDPGQYCNRLVGQCTSCSDLSSVRFTPPQPLLGGLPAGARFPRPFGGAGLVFRANRTGDQTGIFRTTDHTASQGTAITGDGMLLTTPESGPSLGALDNAAGNPAPWNTDYAMTFDRGLQGARKLRRGKPNLQDGTMWFSSEMAPPYNSANAEDYSPAVANQAARMFWMSTRPGNSPPRLLTARIGPNVDPNVQLVNLAKVYDCNTGDLAPWSNREGNVVLLSTQHEGPDGNCAVGRDLWLLAMSNGQPLTQNGQPVARRLTDLNSSDPEHDDAEGAFSQDMCAIFFSSNRGGAHEIYRSTRR